MDEYEARKYRKAEKSGYKKGTKQARRRGDPVWSPQGE